MVDEYKALTKINLPFIEKQYKPGEMIPREDFEAFEAAAAAVVDDRSAKDENASPLPTADSEVARLMEFGSLSDDPEAELHPDSIIPDPNRLSIGSLVAQAEILVAALEEEGKDVPAKLRALTEISDKQIADTDGAVGVDRHV